VTEMIDSLDGRTAFIDGDPRPIDDAPDLQEEKKSAEEAFAQQAVEYYAAEEKYQTALARYGNQVSDEQDKHPLGITWEQAAKILEDRGTTAPKPPHPELDDAEREADQARLNKASVELLRTADLAAKIEKLQAEILDPTELEKAITRLIAKDRARREIDGRLA